jgi:hypothetical protein
MSTDLSTQTPVEIDTVLAANYTEQIKVLNRLGSEVKHLDSLKRQLLKHDLAWIRKDIDETAADIERLRDERLALIVEAAPYEFEHQSRGWNRYYLVTNANGHVHRELNCTTCFSTTEYSWLVDLADCDENAMIEEWGERACTVCFPSAPVNPFYNRPARIDREAREAREAEKAAKQAAKNEKAITDVDGSPLKDDHGYAIKTKIAARNELSGAFQNLCYYGSPEYVAYIRTLVPALEAAGIDWKPVAARAIKKVVKETSQPNPYARLLSAEQIAAQETENTTNLARANDLLKELS